MKKKILVILTATMLLFAMCINTSATTNQYIYEIDNKTIIFDSNTSLDETTSINIVNHLVYGDTDVATYGLMCTLFGHKYESSVITAITHRVVDTDPRCLQEAYEVQTCTRCEYTISERINYQYISCCPED